MARETGLENMSWQVADSAWLTADQRIGIEFEKKKWMVSGSTKMFEESHSSHEPVHEIFGQSMRLVPIKRLARVIRNAKGAFVPIFRHSECCIPVTYIAERHSWKKPEIWQVSVHQP